MPHTGKVVTWSEFTRKARDNALTLTLAEAFACVAMFENGTCNLDPDTLSEAFAMSSGNSLYVAGSLFCDPHHFQQTSVHLSFTQYEIPLITEDNPRHITDGAVVLFEHMGIGWQDLQFGCPCEA